MQTKNTVSIVQKGNKVKFVLVNKSDFAKEYVRVQNKLLKKNENKWEENTLTDLFVVGELKEDGENKISVILENGLPIICYLDDVQKAESDFSRLAKDTDEPYGTYTMLNTLDFFVEGEE
jgi:CRISPR-associated protein Cas8b1/Cst1 subtype I-B